MCGHRNSHSRGFSRRRGRRYKPHRLQTLWRIWHHQQLARSLGRTWAFESLASRQPSRRSLHQNLGKAFYGRIKRALVDVNDRATQSKEVRQLSSSVVGGSSRSENFHEGFILLQASSWSLTRCSTCHQCVGDVLRKCRNGHTSRASTSWVKTNVSRHVPVALGITVWATLDHPESSSIATLRTVHLEVGSEQAVISLSLCAQLVMVTTESFASMSCE